MLALEIEWLLGVCFAARTLADERPDWPPQPDRIFSALVASWGARGERPEERAALEWLEALAPPAIFACRNQRERAGAIAYVPVNDAAGENALPDHRNLHRQPRRFPAVWLPPCGDDQPHLRVLWEEDSPAEHLDALNALAQDTSYVGHSSSLVRCRFSTDTAQTDELESAQATAAPYRGRLRELMSLHGRHVRTADVNARPSRAMLPPRLVQDTEPDGSVFGENWRVLAFRQADRPDLTACAVVGRAMRDALMSAWEGSIPEWLSGHAADGGASGKPHLAIAPMATVGFPHANGLWQGLGLVLPRTQEARWDGAHSQADFAERRAFDGALAALARKTGLIALTLGRLGVAKLAVVDGADLRSLDPDRYAGPARLWSTATPIALDRHPKSDDPRTEMAAIIRQSCAAIGLPPPARVHVHKHAAISGSPSAWPPTGAPPWTGWARPGRLAGRRLIHATIHFAEPVRGPLLLGAGRYFGLGLALPVRGMPVRDAHG